MTPCTCRPEPQGPALSLVGGRTFSARGVCTRCGAEVSESGVPNRALRAALDKGVVFLRCPACDDSTARVVVMEEET